VNCHDARSGPDDTFDPQPVISLGQVPVQVDFSILYSDRQAAQIHGANRIFSPQRIAYISQNALIGSQVVVNLHNAHNGMNGVLHKRPVFLLEVSMQPDFTVALFDRQATQIQRVNGSFFPQRIPNIGLENMVCSQCPIQVVFRNRHFLSTSTRVQKNGKPRS
jgi:hypothetical protein